MAANVIMQPYSSFVHNIAATMQHKPTKSLDMLAPTRTAVLVFGAVLHASDRSVSPAAAACRASAPSGAAYPVNTMMAVKTLAQLLHHSL
jgi:hypothetical protein